MGLQVKLVIIDSVTFHFRQDFTDMGLRTRLLSGMAQKLMSIADRFDIAVSNTSPNAACGANTKLQ